MSLQIIPTGEPVNLKLNHATFLATLDGNRCRTEKMLLSELALVLRFPGHYGENFDALYDCLTDLEWLGVDNIYLHIIHPALICADEGDRRSLEIFFNLFQDVLTTFKEHPIHLHLIAEKSFLLLVSPAQID